MNKKAFLTASICLMLIGVNKSMATPPAGGVTNYQSIDASTAQSLVSSYKNTVQNKFAEFYSIDPVAINNMVTNGATAVRMYNGIVGESVKVALMVPVDANYNNISGAPVMYSMATTGICPPSCDVTKTQSATTTTSSNATAAANNYNTIGTFDSYNAFLVYPAAVLALKNGGATSIQICHGLNAATGARCMIYRGVNASGAAVYLIEDATNMCNRCGM